MTIIELNQGHGWREIDGSGKDEALAAFAARDAKFLAANPQCAPYHRPSWREFEVADTKTANWGTEWYVVDEAGLLRWHSAQYDSSG